MDTGLTCWGLVNVGRWKCCERESFIKVHMLLDKLDVTEVNDLYFANLGGRVHFKRGL